MKVPHLFVSALCLLLSACAGAGGGAGAGGEAGTAMPRPRSPAQMELALGEASAQRMQFRVAIEHYTRAIDAGALSPREQVVAYLGRASAYHSEAEFNGLKDADMLEALHDGVRARALAPNALGAVLIEGYAYQALGAYGEALQRFEEEYTFDQPKPFWSLLNIAATYRIMGDYDSALRYLDRALEISGDTNLPIHYHRARAFYGAGKYREAIDSIGRGIAHQPDYTFAFVVRACAYARLGDYQHSLADYDSAIGFWRQQSDTYGQTSLYPILRDRFAAERESVDDMSKGRMPKIAAASLCQFPSLEAKRERSPLLPPPEDARLPELHILPAKS